jgi:hypothetical protein
MGSRILFCICVITAARADSAESEAAYLRPHGPKGSGDYLKIRSVNPDEITFCLEIFSSAGNLCNLSGSAKRSPSATGSIYVYRSGEGENACTLELRRTPTAWVVRDDARCGRYNCGAGVGIGEIRFLLREKTKARPCIGEDP